MELGQDPILVAEQHLQDGERRSGVWWITVIIVGVFLGNLLSFGAYQVYRRWELVQLSSGIGSAFERQMTQSKANLTRILKEQEHKNEQNRQELKKKAAINKQLRQTCQFWNQRVLTENTAQNRAYRDAACSRAYPLVQ